jgi:tRNA(Ile)-lysidine synthase
MNRILVGLSGGADSVALLHILLDKHGVNQVFAAHINHNLRGTDSDNDEKFVRDLCGKLGIALEVFSLNVKKFAEENNLGTEEAARKLRYDALEKARIKFSADKIAVGHNADDNAETVLMNLCRGAGLKGLCGIPPENGRTIRPLLNKSRAEIEEYLRNRGIDFITDMSNFSDDFLRNRVRNIVMPVIEREINASAKKAIARSAELLRADEEYLEACALCAADFGEGHVYSADKLNALPSALKRRVVRIAIAKVGDGLQNISSAHVSDILDLAQAHSGREIHLPKVVVSKEYGNLIFSGVKKDISEKKLDLSISYSPPDSELINCTKAFSCDKITESLVLRTRRAGDKITFKSGDGRFFTKKLQDFFTDKKIPKSQRDCIPLVAHGSDILWITEKDYVNAKFEADDSKKIYVTLTERI